MKKSKKILFISHDGNRAGAQLLLLDAMKYLKERGFFIYLLILENYGDVFENYESDFSIEYIPKPKKKKKLENLLTLGSKNFSIESFIHEKYSNEGIDLIYTNTIATANIAPRVKSALKIPLISHIHELPYSIAMYASSFDVENLFIHSNSIIACSQSVKDSLVDNFKQLEWKTAVIHSFVDNEYLIRISNQTDKALSRNEFNLPQDKTIIGACGNAEWRKGVDVFINIVKEVSHSEISKNVHFVWIGMNQEGLYYKQLMFDVEKMGISHLISFVPPTPKAKELITSIDIFLLSSREDPFPLVMLEAALCKKPILGFRSTGGCSEFIGEDAGLLAPYLDIKAMNEHIHTIVENKDLREELGEKARQNVLSKYSYELSMAAIEKLILQV